MIDADRLEPRLPPLTRETVTELWSRTYNTHGKPDWSHIFPYYHDKIVFQDSIQRIEGIAAFRAMCKRLAARCDELSMEILSAVHVERVIFLQWKMVMVFRKCPSSPVFGCTKLTLGADGRIVEQRDYFDLWGDIFNGIPGWRRLYRGFMRRFFG